jgi:hypothetical protein
MRSTTLVDLDLTVTIPPELKGVERHSVLIARRGFVYRDFTTCEDEGSCPLVSRMPKRRNLFTLNRLIHRAHRGFVYWDFATCEDEGSCPLVSRMPKRRNLFTLNRLIHRAHRGFVYRDFATCEDEGSCPLVSRMPKRRKLFTLNRWSRSLMDQRPRSRRDFVNREFVWSYPLTTPSCESTKCYPTATCPVPMDGSNTSGLSGL